MRQVKSMRVLYLHGWHSVPGGIKPQSLESRGLEVIQPALDDDDWDLALRQATDAWKQSQPDLLVGSSRGGSIALHLPAPNLPRVLLCPGWRRFGGFAVLPERSLILHSQKDDVVPFDDSVELLQRSGRAREQLLEVGSDHRLGDPQSLDTLHWACRVLLEDGWREVVAGDPLQPSKDANGLCQSEGDYICQHCGEQIVTVIDVSQGGHQQYVEDCPVCCVPNLLRVAIDSDGTVHVEAELEQDLR
ncbi:MAG: CPXCG motif-containing cysteine-rich protein [Pirellulaceae bacterium]